MNATLRRCALIVVALVGALGTRVAAADAPAATYQYDTTPTKVLFIIDTRGGFASTLQELTALPDFVIYGDGTAVWTRYDKKKDLRQLMTARLSPEEVTEQLNYVESLGYKDWYDRYDNVSLPNLPTTAVAINLKDKSIKRQVYGLNYALKQNSCPTGFGTLYEHFTSFKHKDEYEYPIDRVRLFARKLSKMEAKRGYKSLNWGIKQIVLAEIAHDGDDYGSKDFLAKDADRVVGRLRNWTLFSTDLSVIFFKEKKLDFQVGYRPLLPHE